MQHFDILLMQCPYTEIPVTNIKEEKHSEDAKKSSAKNVFGPKYSVSLQKSYNIVNGVHKLEAQKLKRKEGSLVTTERL